MWRRPELFLFVCACTRTTAIANDAAPPPPTPIASALDASSPVALDAAQAEASASAARHAKKAKSIGHTSVVLKIEQTDGKKIVWKPDSRIGRGRYKSEIAAHRLAVLLGIDNVPPALPLDFPRAELARAVEGDDKAKELFAEQIVFDGDVARGAFTEWIDDYAVLPLEKEPAWREWLKKNGAIPDDKRELARDVSTLVLFDYVTGNWDRWSGANIATSNGKTLFVDNDAAFSEVPPKDGLARNERLLEGVDRFSKAVVERLRAASEDEIAKAIDVVPKKAVDGVLARRKKALAIVEKKELYFP